MNKKTRQKPAKKLRKKIVRRKNRKAAKPIDKAKFAFQEIRKDFKRLKKSKQKMQFLWYRTKKEHIALMKDLDKRIKKLKPEIKKRKPGKKASPKKRILRKPVAKKRDINKRGVRKTAVQKKIVARIKEKEVPKIIAPSKQPAPVTPEKELTKE
jgi:hypothetical protein